jgi:membrane protein required for colicin V production
MKPAAMRVLRPRATMAVAMLAGFNGLDYAILALLGFGALYGLSRGALRMATAILSLGIGVYAASSLYLQVGLWIQQHFDASPTTGAVVGYAAVFAAAFVAVEYAGGRVIALARIVHLNWIDRLLGAVFGASIAAIFAGIDVLLLTTILPANPALLRNSKLAPRVLAYNQAVLAYVPPQLKMIYGEKRDLLFRYWNGENQSPGHPSKTE